MICTEVAVCSIDARLRAAGGNAHMTLAAPPQPSASGHPTGVVNRRILAFWSLLRSLVGIVALIDPNIFIRASALSPAFVTPLRLAALYLLFGDVFALLVTLNKGCTTRSFFHGYAFWSRALQPFGPELEFPKIVVQNRITLAQVLVGIAGFMVAFTGQRVASGVTRASLTSLVASILLGVLYIFILEGSITEDKIDNTRAVVKCSAFHEVFLEMILNAEVVFLVLGSAAFFNPT